MIAVGSRFAGQNPAETERLAMGMFIYLHRIGNRTCLITHIPVCHQ